MGAVAVFCGWFLAALAVGTFVEYWAHRAMHVWLLRQRHQVHHEERAQSWLVEFRDYAMGTAMLLPAGFLYSTEAGVATISGGLFYAAFAAFSHSLQHEFPELCVWMPKPVHAIHHQFEQWHCNFGISFDFWDRVFGTYRAEGWSPPPSSRMPVWKKLLRLHWV